jgi:Flp pilus assembly pilin Flp
MTVEKITGEKAKEKRTMNHLIGIYCSLRVRLEAAVRSCKGQGTTEYAILVGVLVVMSIFAILAFKDKLVGLWETIQNAIESIGD